MNYRIFYVISQSIYVVFSLQILKKGCEDLEIYKKVQEACKEAGVSVMELERQLGFSRGSIFKWDTNIPSVERVKLVADKLNKPIDFFIK